MQSWFLVDLVTCRLSCLFLPCVHSKSIKRGRPNYMYSCTYCIDQSQINSYHVLLYCIIVETYSYAERERQCVLSVIVLG